jgi:hypothetical protein
MNISVIDPIGSAWNHMVRILFKPFAFKKWLALGFCAFLAQCGEQVGNSGNSWGNQNNTGNFENAKSWIEANFNLFILYVGIGLTVLLLIALFIVWISSRGKFMLLDGIVKNRGAIKEPWIEFKTLANSLFGLTIIIELLAILCLMIIAGIGVLIAMPDFQSETFSGFGITAIAVTAILLICYIVACIVITFFMQVFLVPTMYLKRVRAIEGWKIAWVQFYSGHKWSTVLLFFMWVLLSIAAGTAAIIVVCATCCCAALPYISSVVLLPISVFFVCYALMYIQQFGNDWVFFKSMCPGCNYDLQGLENGQNCPECGRSLE